MPSGICFLCLFVFKPQGRVPRDKSVDKLSQLISPCLCVFYCFFFFCHVFMPKYLEQMNTRTTVTFSLRDRFYFPSIFFLLPQLPSSLRGRMRLPRITHAPFRIAPRFTLREIVALRLNRTYRGGKKNTKKTVGSKKL